MAENSNLTEPAIYDRYDHFITDPNIDELELGLSVPNIFEVLKVTNKEIRHSNFLAWLLNPNGSHDLGDLFIKRFLRELFSSDKVEGLDPISVMEADLKKARIKREWKNIDLLIELEDIVILIENKFYAKESKGQLKTYKNRVEREFPNHKKVYAFLTKDGVEPEAEKEWYQEVSYQTIIDVIEKILTIYDQNLHPSARVYLNDYQTILKRELMSGDKLSELAQRIYYSHRELMDFIIDNRPDLIDEVREKLLKILKNKEYIIGSENKNYARFYTKNIAPLIYFGSENNQWKKSESFLFEIFIKQEKLKIRSVLSPPDSNYDRTKVAKIIEDAGGSQQPKEKKWLHYFDQTFDFNVDDLYTMEDEEIEELFEKQYTNRIQPMVEKIEQAFLENADLLKELKRDAENAED